MRASYPSDIRWILVLYLLYGGLQYLYMVPAQIYSMHVMLYHARSEY